ncbi:hypothetical protein Tco_1437867 [Tanacetum coccineum]
MVPRKVLTRSGLILLNIARPVNTIQPKTAVNNAGLMKNVINKWHIQLPKAVLSAVKGNVVKASACWVWRPKHKVLDHGNPHQDLKDAWNGMKALLRMKLDSGILSKQKRLMGRDLQLEDANGVDYLSNAAIFEQLTLMGGKEKHYSTIIIPTSEEAKSRKSKKKNIEVPQPSCSPDNVPDENTPTTSNDPLLSGEVRLKLTELMDLCTNLQKKVLDLEKAKTAQDSEIASLRKKVKKLERRNKSRTSGLKRLRKVGSARRVESSDEASLGDQEDASKHGRKIADIDADAEVTLIDETQGRNDDNLMFDTCVLDEQEVEVEKVVSAAEVTTESATTTTVDELNLAQTLIEIKAAKPKVRGVMIQEPSEFTTTPAASKPSQDKGKAKMIESKEPLKIKPKDQVLFDEQEAIRLQA